MDSIIHVGEVDYLNQVQIERWENIISWLLIADISDHLPIFYISRNLVSRANDSKYITIKRRVKPAEK